MRLFYFASIAAAAFWINIYSSEAGELDDLSRAFRDVSKGKFVDAERTFSRKEYSGKLLVQYKRAEIYLAGLDGPPNLSLAAWLYRQVIENDNKITDEEIGAGAAKLLVEDREAIRGFVIAIAEVRHREILAQLARENIHSPLQYCIWASIGRRYGASERAFVGEIKQCSKEIQICESNHYQGC